jgi:predicted transcriptional regulator
MSTAQALDPSRDALVTDLMSQPLLTVEVGESLWDAWQLLFVSGLRHLVVLDCNGASMGVLSDRNILAEVPATAEHLSRRKVGDVLAMVPLVSCLPSDSPLVAARVMSTNAVEAIPVLDERGRLMGIVTTADIIRWLVR